MPQLCILFRVEPDEKVMWNMDARQRSEYEEQVKKQAIRGHHKIPNALGMMVFAFLAPPCIGMVEVICEEGGSWWFALLQFLTMNIIGFAAAVLIYHFSLLF